MFKELSHDKAYLLGFISADGSVEKRILSIQLQEADTYILEQFQALFLKEGYNAILKPKGRKIKCSDGTYHYYSRLRIYGKELISELRSLGFEQNKTFTLRIPTCISNIYMPDFIRGFFDGDGSIRERRKNLEIELISASKAFIESINKWISNNISISLKSITLHDSVYRIQYYSNDTIKLCKIMYETPSILHLYRKKVTYTNFTFVPSPKYWTEEQIEYLKSNYNPNTVGLTQSIADAIGKSYKAVSKQIWNLGLSSRA